LKHDFGKCRRITTEEKLPAISGPASPSFHEQADFGKSKAISLNSDELCLDWPAQLSAVTGVYRRIESAIPLRLLFK